ncbi:aminotransferase-like domain-containing protein [Selenihalanaerobacter shriftii]|uniref:2-aminoadipate transaminase n=1 Tax=Selenihalanaerobacter shriftii TaxID=142842 RepID=A0A1T4Q5V4_9FIRM|nr:PLP-dependent aminotransferase family protein [Selenihalanaerobacter shriftii]SJZ99145.1 2-aminoadipate transaminase [Selenihalanaerobacter shriftii]
MFEKYFSKNAQQMQGSEIREFFKLTEKPEVISFAGGFPNKACLPTKEVEEISSRLLVEAEEGMLQYSPTEGQEMLRKYIVKFMAKKGIDIEVDNVLITSGSQQGLDLVSKIFVDPGDKILTEAPSYVGGLGAIRNYQGDIISIAVDDDGIKVDILEQKLKDLASKGKTPKFIYLIADFNNPTGLTISKKRRKRLVELAEKYGVLILEDDPYSKLRYNGIDEPAIKSFDKEGHVIYLGSFSKIFIPGVRIGWVVAHKEIIQKLILAKQSTDLCTNSFGQRLIATCGEEGIIDKQIEKLQEFYRKKRDKTLESLAKHFPIEASWTEPDGGFYTWVELPSNLNSKEILVKAIDNNVAFVTGSAFYVDDQGNNAFRLSFSQPDIDKIEEGIYRLSKTIKRELVKKNEIQKHIG